MPLLFKRSYVVYCIVFAFLTVRLLWFKRGMYGIPDQFIYGACLLLFLLDTVYLVARSDQHKGIRAALTLLSLLASVGILASIYILIGPEAKPHWQRGEWQW